MVETDLAQALSIVLISSHPEWGVGAMAPAPVSAAPVPCGGGWQMLSPGNCHVVVARQPGRDLQVPSRWQASPRSAGAVCSSGLLLPPGSQHPSCGDQPTHLPLLTSLLPSWFLQALQDRDSKWQVPESWPCAAVGGGRPSLFARVWWMSCPPSSPPISASSLGVWWWRLPSPPCREPTAASLQI